MMMSCVFLFIRLRTFHLRRPANQDADPIDSHLPIDAIIPERKDLPVGVHEAAVRLKDDLIVAVVIGIEIVKLARAVVVLYQEEVLAQLVDVLDLLAHLIP